MENGIEQLPTVNKALDLIENSESLPVVIGVLDRTLVMMNQIRERAFKGGKDEKQYYSSELRKLGVACEKRIDTLCGLKEFAATALINSKPMKPSNIIMPKQGITRGPKRRMN